MVRRRTAISAAPPVVLATTVGIQVMSRTGLWHIVSVTLRATSVCFSVQDCPTQAWMAALKGPSVQIHVVFVGEQTVCAFNVVSRQVNCKHTRQRPSDSPLRTSPADFQNEELTAQLGICCCAPAQSPSAAVQSSILRNRMS